MKAPVIVLSENSFPVIGQNISLECISSSNIPNINYTWYKNEQRLDTALSQTIQLNKVSAEDNGKYQCRTGHTEQIETSQYYRLFIQGKLDYELLFIIRNAAIFYLQVFYKENPK